MADKEESKADTCCTCSSCCESSPICSCCRTGASLDKEMGPTPMADRSCTDILFLVLFFVFWLGMLVIMGVGLATGDPNSIEYGADYMGNRCGIDEGFTDKPKTFYPRIGADVMSQLTIVSTTPWKLRLYGLCVSDCPEVGDAPVVDYGCGEGDCSATCTDSSDDSTCTWDPVITTQSMMNRCVPVDNRNVTVVETCSSPTCTEAQAAGHDVTCFDDLFPEKDLWLLTTDNLGICKQEFEINLQTALKSPGASPIVEYIASTVSGVNSVVIAINECKVDIMGFGLGFAVLCGFLWVALLRYLARFAVYFALFVVVFMMVFATCATAFKAGMAPDFVYERAEDYAEELQADAEQEAASAGVPVSEDDTDRIASALSASEENRAAWQIVFYVFSTLTVVFILLLIYLRKDIELCITLITEATRVVQDIPTIMFFPIITITAQTLLAVFILVIFVFICTAKASAFAAVADDFNSTVSGSTDNEYAASLAAAAADTSLEDVQKFLGCYWIFGYLWTNNLLLATSYTTTACVTAYWFFYGRSGLDRNVLGITEDQLLSMPVGSNFKGVLSKHMGTMAFGSLIVAIVQFARIVLAYIDQQTKDLQDGNWTIKLVMKCVACCLWCFEKSVKFVTQYCYLYTAINGENFCASCKNTFLLFVQHPGSVAINAMVNRVLYFCQSIGIPMLCAVCAYNTVANNPDKGGAQAAAMFTLVLSYTVIRAFGGVFECIVDCLFVAAFRDVEKYDAKHLDQDLRGALNVTAPEIAE